MEIDASTAETAAVAVQERRMRAWRRALPPCTVMQQGAPQEVRVHVPDGAAVEVWVRLEDGGTRELRQLPNDELARVVDDHLMGEASFEVPGDLPPGYHRIGCRTAEWTAEATLIVSPHLPRFPAGDGREAGVGIRHPAVQRPFSGFVGIGDLSDLSDLATWSATQQFASYVLVNPLHAAQPMTPLEPSPYLPTSRRYVNPIYIRPEAIAEYATLDERQRPGSPSCAASSPRTWPTSR